MCATGTARLMWPMRSRRTMLRGNQFAVLVDSGFAGADTFVFGVVRVDVFDRTENSLAEQTVAFWLLGTVVDGFWLGDFAVAPVQDILGAGDSQAHGVKIGNIVAV